MASVVFYLRCSSQMQREKGNSIPTQREACLEYARRNGYVIDPDRDIYIDDGISGRSKDDRLGYHQMMERLKADTHLEAVIAYDISRIFRNVVEYLNFKKEIESYGKKFLSVSENFIEDTPAGWFSETMMSVFAEFRSRQDAEKIRLGMRHKAESGIFPAKAPFGYKNVREKTDGDKDRRWMEANDHEAPWVAKAFQMYATGSYGLYDLVETLNTEGFPTERGKPLAIGTLEKMLKNKLYIGHISWGGIENPNGQHPKLTDEETFYKVQSVLQARNLGSTKKRRYTFLLRGLAVCGECGAKITASKPKNRHGRQYEYYYCRRMVGSKKVICHQLAVPTETLEAEFAALIKSIQISRRVAGRMEERINQAVKKYKGNNEEIRLSLQKKLDEIEARKKSLAEKYVDDALDKATYLSFRESLEKQEMQYRADLEKITATLSSWTETEKKAVELAKNCYRAFKKADYDQKILLAHSIFESLTIKDGHIVAMKLKEPFAQMLKRKRIGQATSA